MKTTFCIDCSEYRSYTVRTHPETITVRDVSFTYMEERAFCNSCGKQVYVPEVNDHNVDARIREFMQARNRKGETV